MKNTLQLTSTNNVFLIKTQLCKLRVMLRSRVTGCVPSWRIQVGDSPANARVNRTKAFSLVLRTVTAV